MSGSDPHEDAETFGEPETTPDAGPAGRVATGQAGAHRPLSDDDEDEETIRDAEFRRTPTPIPSPQITEAATDAWGDTATMSADGPVVSIDWVMERSGEVRLVDIRDLVARKGQLGQMMGVEVVPASVLGLKAKAWDRSVPVVLISGSGAGARNALPILDGMGFKRVASMAGGMREWNRRGLPLRLSKGALAGGASDEPPTFSGAMPDVPDAETE